MVQLYSSAVAFAFLVIIQSVSSQSEGDIGELHFTIPYVTRNFNGAIAWCKNNVNNSTLVVVKDSQTQTALQEFLDSANLVTNPKPMYINMGLNQEEDSAFFLIDGSRYNGVVGNQNSPNSYLFYGHLQNDVTGDRYHYAVSASIPGERRNYICQYNENNCTSDSSKNIVYNGRCYVKFENERRTWYQARERCVNTGGELAMFQSNPSNSRLSPAQFNASWLNISSTYWVGIRYKNWSWKNTYGSNQEAIFTGWSSGKPNNSSYQCVCVDQTGTPSWSWTDCDCTTLRPFVCLQNLTTTKSTRSSSMAAGIGGGGGAAAALLLFIIVGYIFCRRRQRVTVVYD